MSEMKKLVERPDDAKPHERAPYVRPSIRLLGDVIEITRGDTGSRDDGLGTRTLP